MTTPLPSARRSAAAATFLAAAVAIFVWRTAARPGAKLHDFAIYLTASRAWLIGGNPYDHSYVWNLWRQDAAAMPVDVTADITWLQSIAPPTLLPMLSPFAALPRSAAFPLWQGVCVASVVLTGTASIALAGMRLREPLGMVAMAGVLLLGPAQLGVFAGQPAMPSIALAIASVWCARRGRPLMAGALVGVAAALKVQIGIPIIFYHLCMGRIGTSCCGAMVLAIIGGIGVARLEMAEIHWLEPWIENVREASGAGAPNSYVDSPSRDHLVNAQLPLYAVTHRRTIAEAGAGVLFLAMAVAWFINRARGRKGLDRDAAGADTDVDRRELLTFAAWSALLLLPVYHRYYDATLMAAAAWAWALATVARRADPLRPMARLTLVLLLPFALPVGLATTLLNRGSVPQAWGETQWWNVLVRPLHAWLLLLLSGWFTWTMWRRARSGWAASTVESVPSTTQAID